jgi:hypothetical protein
VVVVVAQTLALVKAVGLVGLVVVELVVFLQQLLLGQQTLVAVEEAVETRMLMLVTLALQVVLVW